MRRNCKRLICMLLCVVFTAVAATSALANNTAEPIDFLGDYKTAVQAIQTLKSEWHGLYGVINGMPRYADDVCGMYINDNDRLVVVLTPGATTARKAEIGKLSRNSGIIDFKTAQNSYNSLLETMGKIDSNGRFSLVSWALDERETVNAIVVKVTKGGESAAKKYFKSLGSKIIVQTVTANTGTPVGTVVDDAIIKAFPTAKLTEASDGGSFAFTGAPATSKRQYTINAKTGEALTVHTFTNAQDAAVAFDMIHGYRLQFNGQAVFADAKLPYTYYSDKTNNRVALYCGINADAGKKLKKLGFEVAGGYFASRNSVMYNGMEYVVPNTGSPKSINALLRASNVLFVGTVTGVSNADKDYTVTVAKDIKNASAGQYTISNVLPGFLMQGCSYVFFVRQYTDKDGTIKNVLADNVMQSALDVDSRGYVLPASAYRLHTLSTVDSFVKMLKSSSCWKYVGDAL